MLSGLGGVFGSYGIPVNCTIFLSYAVFVAEEMNGHGGEKYDWKSSECKDVISRILPVELPL